MGTITFSPSFHVSELLIFYPINNHRTHTWFYPLLHPVAGGRLAVVMGEGGWCEGRETYTAHSHTRGSCSSPSWEVSLLDRVDTQFEPPTCTENL